MIKFEGENQGIPVGKGHPGKTRHHKYSNKNPEKDKLELHFLALQKLVRDNLLLGIKLQEELNDTLEENK